MIRGTEVSIGWGYGSTFDSVKPRYNRIRKEPLTHQCRTCDHWHGWREGWVHHTHCKRPDKTLRQNGTDKACPLWMKKQKDWKVGEN